MKLEKKHKKMMYKDSQQISQEENSKKMMKYLASRMVFKPTFQELLS